MKPDLEEVWETHSVQPLLVYDKSDYVEALDVQSTLRGALVEAHFRLRHYYMKTGTVWFDCFSGLTEQIIVLKKSPPPIKSPYKRDIRKGIIPLQCLLLTPLQLRFRAL